MPAKFGIKGRTGREFLPQIGQIRNVAIPFLERATFGRAYPATFVKQCFTLKTDNMNTNKNDQQEQYNLQGSNAADSNEDRNSWDTEGTPGDDRQQPQPNQGDRRNEQDERGRPSGPDRNGDDRITQQPTDPNNPNARREEAEEARENQRPDADAENDEEEAHDSDFDRDRDDETSRPV